MSYRPNKPYNDLPPLPEATELETIPVLRQCIAARAALAELKRAAELIPDSGMLINTLPVLEAQSSTEIENIVTTADRVFEHLDLPSRADAATKEALRYREALMAGYRQIDRLPMSTRMAETICSTIKGTAMKVRRVPGVTLANASSGEVIYTPPEGESRIRDFLADWERFLNHPSEVDPLIRLAAAHYQFEAIHPFTDGNGRTGRVINSLYLIQEGLLPLPILYLSRALILHRNDYYRLLLDVTSTGAWEDWLLFILRAIEETARWTVAKIVAIRNLSNRTAEYLSEREPKMYSRELVDVLFRQPYCRIGNVVEAGIAKRQTASTYLKRLAAVGILTEKQSGREKLFVHTRLLTLLTSDEEPIPFQN
jgi:cell filamentation protein, protein adenylyltransferase